jgi:hypothetical protein
MYHLERLLIQWPTAMHESAVTSLSFTIFNSINQIIPDVPNLLDYLTIGTGLKTPYVDLQGSHITDLSIRVNHDIFRVEVAFSQTLADARKKIGRMLQDESLLGVLLVKIEEKPKWKIPIRKPTAQDWVSKKDWFKSMEPRN